MSLTPTRGPTPRQGGANPSTGSGQPLVLPLHWLSLSGDESFPIYLAAPPPTKTPTPTPTPVLSVVKSTTYTCDAVGNRLTQNDIGGLANYTYESLDNHQ